jgi:hypothetical protein
VLCISSTALLAAQSGKVVESCLQVMATACLFLGCKVTETPKALKDVVRNMWAMRHRGKVPELACLEDPVGFCLVLSCAYMQL